MVPYSHSSNHDDVSWENLKRLKKTKEFIGHPLTHALNIGALGLVGMGLGMTKEIQGADFNWDTLDSPGFHGDVVCLEVLEHLMNPALFMRNLRTLLDTSHHLYLSTPLLPVYSPWIWEGHFTEYTRESLLTLFTYTGFKVVRYSVWRSLSLRTALTGMRPFLRWLMGYRTIIFELEI